MQECRLKPYTGYYSVMLPRFDLSVSFSRKAYDKDDNELPYALYDTDRVVIDLIFTPTKGP